MNNPVVFDLTIPKGWKFEIYHRKDGDYSASLNRTIYAKPSICVKGVGSTIEGAIDNLKHMIAGRALERPQL